MILPTIIAGCTRREPNRLAHAPAAPGMVSVYVVAHGYHTSLAVRAPDVPVPAWPERRDFPDADFLELGWGEREYYSRENPGIALGFRALFIPSKSAVEGIALNGPIDRALPESEIVELHIPQRHFERMVEFVRRTHEFDAHGRPIVIATAKHERGIFYASPLTFSAFHNCNVWTAEALREAGIRLRPASAMTAALLLRQVRPLSAAADRGSRPQRSN